MGDFRKIEFRAFYRTGEDDLVSDFYIPALSAATYYDRSSGYFSASALRVLAKGLQEFLICQGKIRMVISPQLSQKDQEAIKRGIEDRTIQKIAEEKLLAILQDAEKNESQAITLLAALVATEKLEFRVAIPINEFGGGIYHEKFGLFGDPEGDWIAFTGSPNETAGGLIKKLESIAVFRRLFGDEVERITELRKRFQNLWANKTNGALIMDFPTAVRERLLENKPENITNFIQQFSSKNEFELRPYQNDAIQAWSDSGFSGIWSMATGTGKTITALRAISKRVKIKGTVIIIVPSKDLVEQWAEVIKRQTPSASIVTCYSGNPRWRKFAAKCTLQRHLPPNDRKTCYLITTGSTAVSDDFRKIIRPIPNDDIVLVADEVHRFGSRSWQNIFSIPAGLGKLGLSATPIRQWDQQGTNAIFNYFGGIIFEYTLSKAMEDGWLCPYEYHPKLVGMDIDERLEYNYISNKIGKLLASLAYKYKLGSPNFQKILRRAREDGDMRLCAASAQNGKMASML